MIGREARRIERAHQPQRIVVRYRFDPEGEWDETTCDSAASAAKTAYKYRQQGAVEVKIVRPEGVS